MDNTSHFQGFGANSSPSGHTVLSNLSFCWLRYLFAPRISCYFVSYLLKQVEEEKNLFSYSYSVSSPIPIRFQGIRSKKMCYPYSTGLKAKIYFTRQKDDSYDALTQNWTRFKILKSCLHNHLTKRTCSHPVVLIQVERVYSLQPNGSNGNWWQKAVVKLWWTRPKCGPNLKNWVGSVDLMCSKLTSFKREI